MTAFNSVGFHQYDEHFQIVEFANYKMGWIERSKLAWEYREQIRPGLQPLIAYLVFKSFSTIGITDGFNLLLILRIASAVLAVIVIKYFIESYKTEIDEGLLPYFIALSYLLWFLPYINVRFSSESWSGLFFLLSIIFIRKHLNRASIKMSFFTGLLLGLAILFRYQSALLIFGVALWFCFIKRLHLKYLIAIGAGLLCMVMVGLIIDYWLYGEWTVTLYNYFYTNIIKDVASKYGVSPWYDIILYIVKSPGPIGIFILIAYLTLMIFQPKNILLWAVTPFLVAHTILPHKELRFLFPLCNLVPLFLIIAYQDIKEKAKFGDVAIVKIIIILLFIFDTAGLVAVSYTGASKQVAVANFIHRNYDDAQVNIILNNGSNPYIQGPPLNNTFYDGRGIKRQPISTLWQSDLNNYKIKGMTNLLVINEEDFTGQRTEELFKKHELVKVYQNIPYIVKQIYDWYDPSLNDESTWVYEFK